MWSTNEKKRAKHVYIHTHKPDSVKIYELSSCFSVAMAVEKFFNALNTEIGKKMTNLTLFDETQTRSLFSEFYRRWN